MSSTSIYDDFTPTYLYIKQHSITGLLYFGKTSKSDPIKYLGSGTYWQNHINKHGLEHVVTLWYELFTDKDEIIKFALQFSKELNIVESKSWANLIEENGLDGGIFGQKSPMLGKTHTESAKQKIGEAGRGRIHSIESRHKMSIAERKSKPPRTESSKIATSKKLLGRKLSDDTKMKMSKPKLRGICPHCMKVGGIGALKRYHFDNCKF